MSDVEATRRTVEQEFKRHWLESAVGNEQTENTEEQTLNAAGRTFVLSGVSSVWGMPFFQSIVTNGNIQQDELDGTRSDLAHVIATLRNTPQLKSRRWSMRITTN